MQVIFISWGSSVCRFRCKCLRSSGNGSLQIPFFVQKTVLHGANSHNVRTSISRVLDGRDDIGQLKNIQQLDVSKIGDPSLLDVSLQITTNHGINGYTTNRQTGGLKVQMQTQPISTNPLSRMVSLLEGFSRRLRVYFQREVSGL